MTDDLGTHDESTRREATHRSDVFGSMAFPQIARLELDDLLDQLVARARDVQETQGRLRGLLRANLEVARAVDLEEVLQHLLRAAKDLVNAEYAALGVVQQGRLVRFLHLGIDSQTVAGIGHLPEGKGVLGRLIDYPESLRLPDIGAYVSSVGFPEGHPPMRSFLGVPIRVRDRVFGNLYLTDKQGADEFTHEDQELVEALAAAAGVAIENATLFAEARRRHAWQAAMVEVTTTLLSSSDPEEGLRELVHRARLTAGGSGAGVSVPTEDGTHMRVAVAEGTHAQWLGATATVAESASGAALLSGRAVLIADPSTDPHTRERVAEAPGTVGETVAVPVITENGPVGVLTVSRSPGEEPFERADLDLITAYAAQVGLALQLAEVRQDNERLRLVEDRQHIGEDLQHRAVQRLFALGIELQGLLPRIGNEAARTALTAKISDIDSIIRDIREAVFSLHSRPPAEDPPQT